MVAGVVVVMPVIDRSEVMPVSINQKNLKCGNYQGQADPLRIHRDMKEQNHYNDRRKNGKRNPDIAVNQQQDASYEIEDPDKDKPSVLE